MFSKKIKSLIGAVALAGGAFAAPAQAAELVNNGGFETGNFSGWFNSGNLGFTSVSTTNPHSGSFAAQFGPVGSIGSISQTLATVAGTSYNVSIWLRNSLNLSGPQTPNFFSGSFGGASFSSFTNLGPLPYINITSTLTAATNATLLKFDFRQDPDFWYIDDISVQGLSSAVPEPSTWMLLLLGFGVIGFAARRRPSVSVQFA